MEQPISIQMPKRVSEFVRPVRQRPSFSKYPVVHSIGELLPFPNAPLFRQQIKHYIFHMQLLESEVTGTVTHQFRILRPTVFFIFVLEGRVQYTDQKGNLVTDGLEKTHYLCYFSKGVFNITKGKGIYRVMIIAFHPDWFLSEQSNYPEFGPLFEFLRNKRCEHLVYPLCAIGQTTRFHLEKIRTYAAADASGRGSGIFHLLTQMLSVYHRLIQSGHTLASQIEDPGSKLLKDYIEQNFSADEAMRHSELASKLGLNEKKLSRMAYKVFGTSLHQKVIRLRLEKALCMLRGTKLKIHEIAESVGFHETTYFNRMFKKHYRIPPSTVRKKTTEFPEKLHFLDMCQ